jgi:hypothetical protein
MAVHTLLELPPEIVERILSHAELRTLLAFARASKVCYYFHKISLHELSFGVFPTRISAQISQLSESTNLSDVIGGGHVSEEIPEANLVQTIIPDTGMNDDSVLYSFHDALMRKIIQKYGVGLRNLHLTIWRMEWRIAEALSKCPGIKSLSLTKAVEPFVMRRYRGCGSFLDKEEPYVWTRLAGMLDEGAWTTLQVLRLDRLKIPTQEFNHMMKVMLGLKELWMTSCETGFLQLDLTSCLPRLQYLGSISSGRVDVDDVVRFMGSRKLQVILTSISSIASISY